MKHIFKTLLLFTCCLFSLAVIGQNMNLVTPITISMPNNLPANTDDWGKGTQPLIITAKKNTPVEMQSWILVTIKKAGGKVCGSNSPQSAPEVNFDAPVKTWVGQTALSLLGAPCTLSPGDYELCVQFYMKDHRTVIGENCKSFTIKESAPENFASPQNIQPVNEKQFTVQEGNGMVSFRWTPVLPRPKEDIVYRLKVWQLMQGQNAVQAMRSNQPIVTKDVDNLTQANISRLNAEPCIMPYTCFFVWTVEALGKEPVQGKVKSFGISESTRFSISAGDVVPVKRNPPVNQAPADGKLFTKEDAAQPITFRWTPVLPRPKEDVVYKVRATEVLPGETPAQALKIRKPTYEFVLKNETQTSQKLAPRTNGIAWNVEASKTSAMGDIEMLGTSEATSFSVNNGGTEPVKYSPPVNQTPADGKLFTKEETAKPITFRWTPVLPRPKEDVIYKVRATEVLPGETPAQALKIRKPTYEFVLKNETQTSQKLAPRTNGIVWNVEASKTSAMGDIEMLGTSGVTAFGLSGIDCSCTDFDKFTSKPYVQLNGKKIDSIDCGGKLATKLQCNVKYDFAIQYQFMGYYPNNPCGNKDSVVIKDAAGNIIASQQHVMPTTPLSYTFTQSGNYAVTYYLLKGGKICKECTMNLVVECPVTQNCCKNGNWYNKVIYSGSPQTPPAPLAAPGTKLGTWPCNSPKAFQCGFACAQGCATAQINYSIFSNANILVSTATAGSNSVVTLTTPNVTGQYKLVIAAICGKDTCSKLEYSFEIQCSPQTSCCQNATQKEPSVYDAAGANLATFSCAQPKLYTISPANKNCDKDLVIKASAYCGTAANCQSQIVYTLVNTSTSATINGTGILTIPAGLANGAYTLTVDYYCGNTVCKSCKFEIIKDCPPLNIDCCKNSSWGDLKDYTNAAAPKLLPPSGSNLGAVPCGSIKKFKVCYNCAPGCDAAQIKYDVYMAYSMVLVSSTTAASCTVANITMPATPGSYQVVITALCNGKQCNAIDYMISTECTPADCCKGGSWGEKLRVNANGSTTNLEACGSNLGTAPCGYSGSLKVTYNCNPQCNAPAQIVYQYYNAVTNTTVGAPVTVSSGNVATITNPSVSGSYYLSIAALCNGKQCDECKLYFKLACNPTVDCCKGGSWGEKLRVNANGSTTNLEACGSNLGTAPCGYSGSLKVTYNCNPQCNTTAQIVYQYYNAATNTAVGSPVTVSSSVVATITNPSVSGSYYLSIAALCNGKQCDECKLYFKLACNQATDCCKGSSWTSKSLDWDIKPKLEQTDPTAPGNQTPSKNNTRQNKAQTTPAGKMPPPIDVNAGPSNPLNGSIKINNCGDTIRITEGGDYTFNAGYTCNPAMPNCKGKVIGMVKTPAGLIYGTWPLPHLFSFTTAGIYTVTYYAYCGETVCDSCTFYVNAERDCCRGSFWRKAQYQIVNKKPNGDPDRGDGAFYNLPTTLSAVPTYKADLAVDVENLDYECRDDGNCNAGYIIRRKNLTTGALVYPDETLSPGQVSTSIYSKPFPQIIYITPTCGGKVCGNAIIFKVECKHKNCIFPICNTSKYELNFSTGQNGAGGQIATGLADPYWQGGLSSAGYTKELITWNKIPGASILVPAGGDSVASATFRRCFYVCEETEVNFSGIFRDDNKVSAFELKNTATSSIMWSLSASSFPTNDPQCYIDNPFSGSVFLPKGEYCFVFTLTNVPKSFVGFALKGTLSASIPVLSNTAQECCENATTTAQSSNNIIDTVKICDQIWMKKNLDVETYRNGDPIPQVTDDAQWISLTTGAWCYYNNDPAMGAIYGKLYNWYALNDPRGLAPTGWHIPSKIEWTTLSNCLGGNSIAGGKMKEIGTIHWLAPNIGATNSSGFSGLPGGARSWMYDDPLFGNNGFQNIGSHSFFWSSTTLVSGDIAIWNLIFDHTDFNNYSNLKPSGLSVRCIKD